MPVTENTSIPAADDVAPETVAIEPAAPATDNPTPRRWPWLVALLLLAAVALLALYAIHNLRNTSLEQTGTRARVESLEQALEVAQRELQQLRGEQRRLEQRQDATTATNKVLREDVLGMGERAALLEEAVARLAQSRLGGESTLRLNEAEFLLVIGAARLQLHGDAKGTIAAFELAEQALAGLDDPALSTLRQTLAEEQAQLHEIAEDPRLAVRAELGVLASQLPQLPAAVEAPARPADAQASRLSQLLAQLVTVRRYDPATTLLGPSQRQASLAALELQLELAQAALDRGDPTGFQVTLKRLEAGMEGLFDPDDAKVKAWQARLASLAEARLQPDLPALGATLRELRNLRAVRQARDAIPAAGRGSARHPAARSSPPEAPRLERETSTGSGA